MPNTNDKKAKSVVSEEEKDEADLSLEELLNAGENEQTIILSLMQELMHKDMVDKVAELVKTKSELNGANATINVLKQAVAREKEKNSIKVCLIASRLPFS